MLNCREVEEQVISITQAEAGVQMASTHKCRKTYYLESRDGNIHALEALLDFDALIVPSLTQELIGGRAITNDLEFQLILDKDPNIAGIYPRFNGKLCSVEQSIPFISDDLLFFRLKTLHMAHHSFVKKTGLDLWHRRLGHVANESIQRTVEHSLGVLNVPKKIPRGNC